MGRISGKKRALVHKIKQKKTEMDRTDIRRT